MRPMKKYLILTAAAIAALVSCSKVQTAGDTEDRAISFQVGRYQNTKADPADYKDDYASVPFGAYAWYKGVSAADNTVFMTNQKVSYKAADNIWTPEGITYYWPKTGTLDFICYSPYVADAKGISVTEDKIAFTDYTPGTDDLMYGDKATGLSDNAKTYYYNGVPVLFHHVLAKLEFVINAAYLEKTAGTGDKTKWEITVSKVTIKGVAATGSLELALDGSGWKLPADKVWTPGGATKDITLDAGSLATLTDEPQALGGSIFVLPQLLAGGPQVEIEYTIKTYHDKGSGYELILTEKDITATAALVLDKLPQWGINQAITYTFSIAPTPSSGSDPKDTDDPVDPKNPDLKNVEITFDPVQADWEVIDAKATIQL